MEFEISTNHKTEILSDAERAKLILHKAVMLEAANLRLQAGFNPSDAMIFVDEALSSAKALGETDFSFASEYIRNALPIAMKNLYSDVNLYESVRSDMLLSKIVFTQERLPIWAEVAEINISSDMRNIQMRLNKILKPRPSRLKRFLPGFTFLSTR